MLKIDEIVSTEDVYQKERSFTAEQAETGIATFLSENNLKLEFVYQNEEYEVSRATVYNNRGSALASGAGKGIHHEIGAKAEAIEHYLFSLRDTQRSKKLRISAVSQQKEFSKDYFLSSLVRDGINDPILIEPFENDNSDTVYVPSAYVDPEMFNEQSNLDKVTETRLGRFCSNTGGALGLSPTDSMLHGLNEAVERHYESLLFQSMIGIDTKTQWQDGVRVGTKATQRKLELINREYGQCKVVITKSFAGNYVAFAFGPLVEGVQLSPIGAGCSAFCAGSVQRAVDELAQTIILAEAVGLQDTAWIHDDILAADTLRSDASLECLVDFSSSEFEVLPGFEEPESIVEDMSSEKQLKLIAGTLSDKSYNVLTKSIFSGNGIHLYQTFVPDLDKFYVIRRGNRVAPLWAYKN